MFGGDFGQFCRGGPFLSLISRSAVTGNRVEPGFESVSAVKSVHVLVRFQECFLHYIFGILNSSNSLHDEPEQVGVMTPDQPIKAVVLAQPSLLQ